MKINKLDKATAAKVTALLSAAVVTASSMSGVTAYAEELPDAYNAAELAEEVLTPAVADPTKFDFFGTYILTHDEQGSPEPQIIRNEDGSYVIIIYEGQSVAFPVNNPWADLGIDPWGNPNKGYVDITPETKQSFIDIGYMGDFDIDGQNYFQIGDCTQGSAVIEVAVTDGWYDKQVGNTITVGLFVLPAVPGAQAPTLTQDEIEEAVSRERDKEYFKDKNASNGWIATRGGSF